jgi:hypothetical protein
VRLLYRVVDDELFARAVNRRDFVRVSDGTLWAHESHDWLVAAGSGVAIAHRTGHIYYGADDGLPLYYEAPETLANLTHPLAHTAGSGEGPDDRRESGR